MTKLTLGPIAYHWSAEARSDFYARIADEAPVDEVYLGEVICSKRAPFHEAELPATIERLERAGKRVILSTLAEVMLKRERKATEDLAEIDAPEIEINNAAGLFARGRRPHRIGPFMNAYNEATIGWMAAQGATHVCLPSEMPAPAIAVAARAARELGLGVEVQVFGRVSLAVSARCYHARAHGRTKDNCQFVCEEDPDGMPLRSRDEQPILRVNGIQTQSESYLDLLPETPQLVADSVTHLRLMPQRVDMVAVAQVFRDAVDGRLSMGEADARLAALSGDARLSNGFYHGAAGYRRIAMAAPS
ncbi:Collagenase-like protease, PrtC family [Celeribacter baekdonensis]|uniref:Ubiquinone biosynthesis protein UbiV n=1 Tax=Celeribacter baekdonensis TaxID=875171 RepID=A0A1G7U176_9RHOB|nr:U32 family peptidase [Celeribacter baekdonensis]SDG41168.1 Collagenase-like protease, PrtC family [Celeribacter baekdonensis]